MNSKCGLLGKTLRHSYSKLIHSVFADYEYELYNVDEKQCEEFIRSGDFLGLNVTIPYKELAYSLCDECSPTALEAGCVNTVIRRNGKIYGENTDVFGFMYMLEHGKISLTEKNVLVLGSGGTSKTACLAAKKLRAAKVTVVSRSGAVNYENVYDLKDTQIIINTTPVGMYPGNGVSPIDLSRFPLCEGVADVIYNPQKTRLLLSAEAMGIANVNGLYMLSAQGFRAAELFLGRTLPEELIEKAVSSVRKSTENIVLIGMPGSGKSTIAKLVAESLSRKLFDTDAEIEARFGSPESIIRKYGEAAFRDIEEKTVAEASKESGLVISTGGGVVEREANYASLAQNGRIYFIERDLASLDTSGRPLSKDLPSLFHRRKDKYLRFCDKKIQNTASPVAVSDEICEDFLNI